MSREGELLGHGWDQEWFTRNSQSPSMSGGGSNLVVHVLMSLAPDFLCRNFPIRGIQLYDGPVNIQNCTFRKFVALDGRHTSALAFRLNNAWQSCPHNNVTNIAFEDVPVSEAPGRAPGKPWLWVAVTPGPGACGVSCTATCSCPAPPQCHLQPNWKSTSAGAP